MVHDDEECDGLQFNLLPSAVYEDLLDDSLMGQVESFLESSGF